MASKQGYDIVFVRNSGPVKNMRLGPWFAGLAGLILVVLLAGLVAGGFLFYKQSRLLAEFGENINLLMLRAERLEYLSQEQETRDLLAEETARQRDEATPRRGEESLTTTQPVVKPEATGQPPSEEEPRQSDTVAISGVSQEIDGGEMVINFDVINKVPEGDRTEGYVALILHGQRRGKPWMEAKPPMRLTPLGRPVNYRRGTPFAVQRYRHVTARFSLAKSQFERLEIVIYSRKGQVLLVHGEPITAKAPEPGQTPAAETPVASPTEATPRQDIGE